jgi:hypothetical protein
MGKDLHYSIRPFIERALINHFAVDKVISLDVDDFYAYKVTRKKGMSNVIVVLSDAYNFNEKDLLTKPKILKNGGFFLIAKPEGRGIETSIPKEKLGLGKLAKLMGALNRNDYWNYEPPTGDEG